MFKLWLNENLKIYKRLRTWIMFGLLFLLVIGGSIVVKVSEDMYQSEYEQQNKDWKDYEREKIEHLKNELNSEHMDEKYKSYLEREIEEIEYKLEHDIAPTAPIWNNIEGATTMAFQLLTLFVVIIAADIVASEFTWGTIKLLLIRSVSRTKILLAKYLATLSFALLLLVLLFVSIFTISGILYGFDGFNQSLITITPDGEIIKKSRFLNIFQSYGIQSVSLIIIVTIAFMISTVFRSSSLAIGISLLTLFMGSTISIAFFELGFEWVKYFLFIHTINLQEYMISGHVLMRYDEMGNQVALGTLGQSITIISIYYIIFLFIAWFIFNKRDIKA
ncbi:hypothetical protein CIB95_08195 [Lottiidibacillus patelloidae]|uniref:ABC transporter permease n=1 Tax=Lottiidibacillus patelloidae TaxID=2670334 RepID=A0A263BV31_9BACI|nr:ABC transporter permease [Lottiidibacillus patelloidae]OZM57428.1 hypothetical protein CIB95_08195 [Lottiidibacillus patelloidae]